MRTEHSAGAVLFTLVKGVPHYVLVQEIDGHVGLPKGHVEPGETIAQTALREIWEETGIHAELRSQEPLWTERYTLKAGGEKQVDYFLASFEGQTPAAGDQQVAQVLLLPCAQAQRMLTHENPKEFLAHAEEIIRNP